MITLRSFNKENVRYIIDAKVTEQVPRYTPCYNEVVSRSRSRCLEEEGRVPHGHAVGDIAKGFVTPFLQDALDVIVKVTVTDPIEIKGLDAINPLGHVSIASEQGLDLHELGLALKANHCEFIGTTLKTQIRVLVADALGILQISHKSAEQLRDMYIE